MYAAGGLAVLAIVYFDYLRHSVNARVIVICSLTGILGLLCSLTLLKETFVERKPGTGITARLPGVPLKVSDSRFS
jgi:hypothetical protein